jgi:hypothetical protein
LASGQDNCRQQYFGFIEILLQAEEDKHHEYEQTKIKTNTWPLSIGVKLVGVALVRFPWVMAKYIKV